jgi:hypothetical protein
MVDFFYLKQIDIFSYCKMSHMLMVLPCTLRNQLKSETHIRDTHTVGDHLWSSKMRRARISEAWTWPREGKKETLGFVMSLRLFKIGDASAFVRKVRCILLPRL